MNDLNTRGKAGKALFLMSGTDSHMMNGETVLQLYQELYSDGFKARRLRHGLTHQHRGLLLCDGFTGSHAESGGLAQRRQRWADACNVELPDPPTGGMVSERSTVWPTFQPLQAWCEAQNGPETQSPCIVFSTSRLRRVTAGLYRHFRALITKCFVADVWVKPIFSMFAVGLEGMFGTWSYWHLVLLPNGLNGL